MGAAGAGGGGPVGQAFFYGHYKGQDNDNDEQREEYTWTVPDGVTSVSIVAIGGGEPGVRSDTDGDGGTGGSMYWANEVSATPGDTWNINVANGWLGRSNDAIGIASAQGNDNKGQTTYVTNGSGTTMINAAGGDPDSTASSAHSSATSEGGEAGWTGYPGDTDHGGGGGYAGGYDSSSWDGGRAAVGNKQGRNGHGMGVTGIGDQDLGAASADADDGHGLYMGTMRGFGGGGGGFNSDNDSQTNWGIKGGPGAVRIMWGGDRSFPSNAEDIHPIADAGTQLEVKLIPPLNLSTSTTENEQPSNKHHLRFTRIEIYDDQGNELVRTLTSRAHINNSSGNSFEFDYDAGESITNNSLGENTWDNFNDDEWAILMNEDGSEQNPNITILNNIIDTDRDSYVDIKWGLLTQHPDNTASLKSNNYSPGSYLFNFGTAKVIKEIRFYNWNYFSMAHRTQVILDGNVIADGNFHKVDRLQDQDQAAVEAHPDYNTDGDISIRDYWRLRFT